MKTDKQPARMPVLFVGHGSPMNIIAPNQWADGFAALGANLPIPNAILAISAHWYVDGTWLTANEEQRTIHDFYGFPSHLYEVEYPAPGHVDLARQVERLLKEHQAGLSTDWGLDHGTWSVLTHMFPRAQVPVIQLSIDRRLPPTRIPALARSLQDLRHQGILILASGNLTHNLRDAMQRMRTPSPSTPSWATAFDKQVITAVEQRDTRHLVTAWPDTDLGHQAHPSGDHWLPLLYAYGATDQDDTPGYPIQGFDAGSLSMRSILWG